MTANNTPHQINLLQVIIKEKSTEDVLLTYTTPVQLEEITKKLKQSQEEHILYEDDNHNSLKLSNLVPPCIVFVCRFVPSNKCRKRRNVVSSIDASPSPLAGTDDKSKKAILI